MNSERRKFRRQAEIQGAISGASGSREELKFGEAAANIRRTNAQNSRGQNLGANSGATSAERAFFSGFCVM